MQNSGQGPVVGAAVVAGVGVVLGGSVDGAEVEASSLEMQVAVHTAPTPPLLRLSDLHEVAAFVAVGVLGGQSECRAGEVQLAFALLSALELDNTLDVLAIGVRLLGGEVDGLTDGEGDRLLGLARGTSVTFHMEERDKEESQGGPH